MWWNGATVRVTSPSIVISCTKGIPNLRPARERRVPSVRISFGPPPLTQKKFSVAPLRIHNPLVSGLLGTNLWTRSGGARHEVIARERYSRELRTSRNWYASRMCLNMHHFPNLEALACTKCYLGRRER